MKHAVIPATITRVKGQGEIPAMWRITLDDPHAELAPVLGHGHRTDLVGR